MSRNATAFLMAGCKIRSGKSTVRIIITIFSEKEKSIHLTLPSGDACPKGGNYGIVYNIKCDEKADVPQILNPGDFDAAKCVNTVNLKSKHGILFLILSLRCGNLYFLVQ